MENKTHRLTASFTLLNLWDTGRWEQAVKYYFRLEKFITPAMAEGERYHNEWKAEAEKTGCLPAVFGGKKLKKPITEQFVKVDLSDWLTLSGRLDCVDEPIVYEYKTGATPVHAYTGGWQIGVYGVLATAANLYVQQAAILHYDQYTKEADSAYVWLTDKKIEDAINWVESVSAEVHNYFVEQGLYKRFGERRGDRHG